MLPRHRGTSRKVTEAPDGRRVLTITVRLYCEGDSMIGWDWAAGAMIDSRGDRRFDHRLFMGRGDLMGDPGASSTVSSSGSPGGQPRFDPLANPMHGSRGGNRGPQADPLAGLGYERCLAELTERRPGVSPIRRPFFCAFTSDPGAEG